MASCRAHTCVLWRFASEFVAGKNRRAKFRDANSQAAHIVARENLFVRSSPRGPRSASMYETSLDRSSHVKVSMFTPEAISRKTF